MYQNKSTQFYDETCGIRDKKGIFGEQVQLKKRLKNCDLFRKKIHLRVIQVSFAPIKKIEL